MSDNTADLYATHPSGGIREVFYKDQYSTTLIGEEIEEWVRDYTDWGWHITLHPFAPRVRR